MDDKMKQDFAEYLTKSFITFMDLSRTIDGLESYYLRNKSLTSVHADPFQLSVLA